MAPRFKALVSFTQDPGSVPGTHMVVPDLMTSSDLTYTRASKTVTYKIK